MKTLLPVVALALAACAKTDTRLTMDTDDVPAIHAMYERNVSGCRRDALSQDRHACMWEAARSHDEPKREALQRQRSRTQLGKPVATAHLEQ